ncbi:MAG: hypothetical protein PVF58_00015 [Candidatus Methanofastidiosia archaeon]
MNMKKVLYSVFIIVFLGAALSIVHWSLLVIAGILGGYIIEETKKALTAFIAGILSWLLLFTRYFTSGHFGQVSTFINNVAGIPAFPLVLVIGGILALLGALIGVTGKKAFITST